MVNCIHVRELDVRLLNFSIQTSVAQVMALFSLDSAARPVQLDQCTSANAPWPVTNSASAPPQVHLSQVRSARPCQVSSARSVQLGQFRSARLGLTTCDLQLRKVITSSSDLCLGCS